MLLDEIPSHLITRIAGLMQCNGSRCASHAHWQLFPAKCNRDMAAPVATAPASLPSASPHLRSAALKATCKAAWGAFCSDPSAWPPTLHEEVSRENAPSLLAFLRRRRPRLESVRGGAMSRWRGKVGRRLWSRS